MELLRKQRHGRSFGDKYNESEFRSVEMELPMENPGRVSRKPVGPEFNREKAEMNL